MSERRVIIITGASDGIGAAAARTVAGPDTRLILVGRSTEKTARIAAELGAEHFIADYARLDDVRALAAAIRATVDRIDVLANNAGGILGAKSLTADGFEKTMQVNHLAPFLLTMLLIDLLQAGEGVVINTASSAPRRFAKLEVADLATLEDPATYSPNRAYGDAKLENILFTRGLDARYGDAGIHTVSFDPGNVATNFASESTSVLRFIYRTPLARLVLISPERGGANLAYFITGIPGASWQEGGFYTQTRPATKRETSPRVHDDALVDGLWRKSAELVGLSGIAI